MIGTIYGTMLKFLQKRAGSSPYHQIKGHVILAAADEDEPAGNLAAKRYHIHEARKALGTARTTYVHDPDYSAMLDRLEAWIEDEEDEYRRQYRNFWDLCGESEDGEEV